MKDKSMSAMKKDQILYPKTQAGFTLLELLLSVTIFGMIMMGVFQILNDSAERELARSTSQYMENIAEAVEETLTSDLNVFTAFYGDLQAAPLCSAPNWVCAQEYTVANLAAGFNIGAFPVPPSSALGNNVRAVNPLRSNITIVMTIADDPSDANDIPAINFLIAASERAPIQKVLRASSQAGPNGGVFDDMYPDFAPPASGTVAAGDLVESAFGAWTIDILDFRGTAWYATVLANPPTPANGTYLVHRGYVNFQDAAGDYLFRVQQPNPELHVMLSNLNLGGNNIIGADNIIVQDNLIANNQIIVEGQARLMQNLEVDGSLYSDGPVIMADVDFQHDHPDLIGGTRIRHIAAGSFIDSSGNPNANRFTTLGTATINTLSMNAGGELSADTANLRTIDGNDLDVTDTATGVQAGSDVTVNTTVNATGFFADNAGTTTNISELNATAMNFSGSNFNVNGNIGMLQMNTDANIDVNGSFNVPVISNNNVDINGTFGNCIQGCGN
jgi:prepilin-type N-terminal cleavage/methylation domain-containing protein